MEIVKDKRIGGLVFLLCLAFLLLASCAFAQSMSIERTVAYNPYYKKDLVKKYPSYALEFENKSGTTFMSIYADSLNANAYSIKIYVYYTEDADLNNSIIKLVFDDGGEEYFSAFEIDNKLNYVEYSIPLATYYKMCDHKVTGVSFNKSNDVVAIKDGLYFSAFLHRHYR